MTSLKAAASSLKLRLTVATALVVGVCVIATSALTLREVELRTERAVLDLEAGNAERMASLVSHRVVALQAALRAAAEAMPKASLDDADAQRAALLALPVLRTMFYSVFVARPDGRLVAHGDANGVRETQTDIGDRHYFRKTLSERQPWISEPLVGRVVKEPVLIFTMPVTVADGSVGAVIGGSLRLSAHNLIEDLSRGGGNSDDPVRNIVIDTAGRILAHPVAARVMGDIDAEPGLRDAIVRWEREGRPAEPTATARHDHGHFVTLAGVPGTDWLVVRVAADEVLMGGISAARKASVEIGLGVALAGGLLMLGLVWWLLRPMARLRQRAGRLHDGEPGSGWPRAGGEIGELSSVLRQAMIDRAASDAAASDLAHKMASVLAAAPIGIAFTRARRFELVSREFAEILGYEEAALTGRATREIYASEEEFLQLGPAVGAAFAAGRAYFGELRFLRRDGALFWGRLQGRPVETGNPDAGTIWLLEDVTDQRANRERLAWAATHDALTRLSNREAFEARLAELLATPTRPAAALMCVDLDRFKAINDAAGHAAGDQVLRDVAALLVASVRADDTVARLGGDEFALLLPHCEVDAAQGIAERIRDGARAIGVDQLGVRLRIGASIGVVGVGPEASDAAELLARADTACYEAKRSGRDAVRVAAAPLRLVLGSTVAQAG